MKKLSVFAAVVGVTLVSAAPPPSSSGVSASGGYPPCSRTVTDRCIQLYERGVRTPQNLAMNERLGPGRIGVALGGPYEPATSARPAPREHASHRRENHSRRHASHQRQDHSRQHASHQRHEPLRTVSRGDCPAGDGELG